MSEGPAGSALHKDTLLKSSDSLSYSNNNVVAHQTPIDHIAQSMLNLPTLPYVKAPGIHTRAPHVQQQVLVPSADGTVYHVTQHFTIPSELVAAVAQVVSASSNDLSSGSIEELSDEASDCCTLTEPTPPPRPFHHPSQPESTAHRLKASDSSGQDLHLAKRLFSDSGVEAGCAEDMASTSTEPGNHKKQRRTTNTQQESQILQYGTESGGMLTSIRSAHTPTIHATSGAKDITELSSLPDSELSEAHVREKQAFMQLGEQLNAAKAEAQAANLRVKQITQRREQAFERFFPVNEEYYRRKRLDQAAGGVTDSDDITARKAGYTL